MNDKGKHKTVDLADTVGAIHELPLQKTSTPQDLPEGWVWKTLGEACNVILGQSPESTTYNTERNGLPFFQGKAEFGVRYPTVVKWCSAPKKVAQKNDVLISVRAPVGPTNLAPSKCCIGRGLAAIRPLKDIEYLYVFYYLKNIEHRLSEMGTGTTFKAISGDVLRSIEIPLAPLDQQKLIVAEIEKQFSRLDEAVAGLKRIKANLKRYKASVLKAAVEGKLTEEWRSRRGVIHCALSKGIGDNQGVINHAPTKDETGADLLKRILAERKKKWEEANPKKEYKEPAAPDTSNLPELPKGWVWATVGQVSFISSGQTPRGIDAVSAKGNIPWFRVGDMNTLGNEKFMHHGAIFLSEELARKLGIHIQPAGTIIFPKRGGAIATNKKRILSKPSSYDLNTMGIFPIGVSPEYFWNWFLSINLGSLGDGSNVPQINNKDIDPLLISLPPLSEQVQIASEIESRLSITEGIEAAVETNLKRAERLRQAILKKAFSGGLV